MTTRLARLCILVLLYASGTAVWAQVNDLAIVIDKSSRITEREKQMILEQLDHHLVQRDGRLAVIGVEAVVTDVSPLAARSQGEGEQLLDQLMVEQPASGSGNVAAGIERALSELEENHDQKKTAAVLVVSSGMIQSGSTELNQSYTRWLENILANKAKTANIQIDWIADDRYRQSALIHSVTKATGGTAYFVAGTALPSISLPEMQDTPVQDVPEVDSTSPVAIATVPAQETVIDHKVEPITVPLTDTPAMGWRKPIWLILLLLPILLAVYLAHQRRKRSAVAVDESVNTEPSGDDILPSSGVTQNFNELLDDPDEVSRLNERPEMTTPVPEKPLINESAPPLEPRTRDTVTLFAKGAENGAVEEDEGRTLVRPLKKQ